MDKYERRRLRLAEIKDTLCDGRVVDIATKTGKDATYISRLLYPADKAGAKRMGENMREAIEKAFNLPKYWLDQEPGAEGVAAQDVREGDQEPAKPVIYSESIQAVIDLMLTLSDARQGYIRGIVANTIKTEFPPEQQQKVAGRTGTR